MKLKKIMFVSILLAILTMGAVCATDEIVSDELATDDGAADVQLSQENDFSNVLSDGNFTEDVDIVDGNPDVYQDENFTTVGDEEDDDENPYYIFVNEEEISIDPNDAENFVAGIILPNNTNEGRFNAFVDNDVLFNNDIDGGSDWHYDDAGNLKCHIYQKDMDLNLLYDGAEVEFSFFVGDDRVDDYTKFMRVQVTDTTIRFYYDEDEDEWDGEDGVIINVINGDDKEFNLNDDLGVPFAFISVSDDLQGSIRIYIYDDEEDEGAIYFEKSLFDITNKEADEENEGFTVYSICLDDFGDNLYDVLEGGYFEIGFFQDDGDDLNRIDSRAYNIEYYDDDVVVKFWECGDDDEEENGLSIYVDTQKDYSTDENSPDADNAFITVYAQDGTEYHVAVFSSKKIFFDKNLIDFENAVLVEDDEEFEGYWKYAISLRDVDFLNGLDEVDKIWIGVYKIEDGYKWLDASKEYVVFFNDDSTFSLLEILGFRVFYGNLTSGETADGMISFATKNFMEINIPDSFSVNEINIAVDYGNETETYSLGDFNVTYESDEEFSGRVYSMDLTDEIKDKIRQHENETVTFNLNYIFKGKNISASFKRILKDNLFYYVSSIYDLYILFDFNIASDVLNSPEDEAVNFFCFDSNWHVAHNDLGGGHFKVYVNGSSVKELELHEELVSGSPRSVSLSLDDLGINASGTYNIKITHLPDSEIDIYEDDETGEQIERPCYILTEETEVLSKDVVVDFDYVPIDPELTVEVEDVVYAGGMIEITIRTLADSARVLIDGKNYTVAIVDGVGILQIPTLSAGTYTVTAISEKTGTYRESEVNKTFKVNKAATDINIVAGSIAYGEDLVVGVKLPSDVKYRVNVSVGGMSKLVSLKNGVGSVKFSGLAVGTYNVSASYAGDVNYLKALSSAVAKVNRGAANIEIVADDIHYGESLSVTVKLPVDVTRRANVTVADESKLVSLKNGEGTVKFDGLAKGNYNIVVTYGGDSNYLKSSANAQVKVTKPIANIIISASDIVCGEDLVVGVELPSDVKYRVNVSVGGMSKLVSLKGGVGSVKFSGLAAGTYTVSASYAGDGNYSKSFNSTSVKVNRGAADIKVTANPVSYGEDVVVDIQLPTDVTRRVNITVGNVTKLVSLNKGHASVSYKGLTAGIHNIEVSYGGDSNYLKSSASATVKVNKATPEIQVVTEDITLGEDAVVYVTLPSDVSRRAVVTIDGVPKPVSLHDGSGFVKFSGLEVRSYDVQVSYNGDANYKSASTTAIITVSN